MINKFFIEWKEVFMQKKTWLMTLQILAAVIYIVTQIDGKIDVQVDEKTSEEFRGVMAPAFEQINTKLDRHENMLASINQRQNEDEVSKIITTITKQGQKIRDENWIDIHQSDIDLAVSGYAKLQKQEYDAGQLAKLEPDIELIKLYNSGKIGPS